MVLTKNQQELLAELERVEATITRISNTRPWGSSRTKRFGRRVDAQLRRTAELFRQRRRLMTEIRALGGEVKEYSERLERESVAAPSPVAPKRVFNPRGMTDDELKAEDQRMNAEKRAVGAYSITDEHRAVKAELGRRSAVRTTQARRSAAGKKAAETRRRREAMGLPPKKRGFSLNNPPPGGWTEADRVN